MNAVIMAGGEGIRLRPLTITCSKPMLPVVNRPLIEHSIDYLKRYAIKDIAVSLYYQPDDIINLLGDGSSAGVNLAYSVEETPLGTAGGVKRAVKFPDKRTIVISGDTVSDISLEKLLDFHDSKRSDFTAALVTSERPEDYGVAEIDSSMRITSFQEKPDLGRARSNTINTGIYVIEPHVLQEFVPDFERCDFSLNLIPLLIKKKKRIFGFIADGYWCDAGTVSSYLEVHRDLLDGCADICLGGDLSISTLRYLSSGPVLLGPGSEVSPGANIAGYSVIGAGTVVEKGVFVADSVVHEGTAIGRGAVINGSIVGKNCTVGSGAVIGGGAVIGDGCFIPADAVLPSGIKLAPGSSYAVKSRVQGVSGPAKSFHGYSFPGCDVSRSEMNYEAGILINDFISRLKRFNAQ